ncbi:DUF2637 domain-containing protein [Nocardiopsis alba]|uniref:DUF2637 domain-containing protein n=1 Tax=Nocardiopsis alba TaxID=53437 RepID=UPI00382392D6
MHAAADVGATDTADIVMALFFAALVPVALLLVAEMLIRSGREGGTLAVVMWVGAAAVAVGAAIMSFSHMYEVVLSFGQPKYIAALMPVAVDGLMLVASVSLARAGRATAPLPEVREEAPPLPEVREEAPPLPEAEAAAAPLPEASPGDAADASQTEEAPEPQTEAVADPLPEARKPATAPPEPLPFLPELGKIPDGLTAAQAAEADAVDYIRASQIITGKMLGDAYGRSDSWGRDRIRTARANLAEQVPVPA